MHFLKSLCLTAAVALTASVPAQAPRLLPFQGKLTDSAGVAVPDGAKVIQFKLYDAPTAGNVVWPGEVHTVTVNGGLVNVLLGTQSAFSDPALFNRTVYLEITVDVNGDRVINDSDPAMQPRQLIVPVIFAQDAGKLEGQRWQEFFVDPNGGDPAAAPADSRAKDAAKLKDREWTDFFTTEEPATAKAKDADKLDGHDWSAILTSGNDPVAQGAQFKASLMNVAPIVVDDETITNAGGELSVKDGGITPGKLSPRIYAASPLVDYYNNAHTTVVDFIDVTNLEVTVTPSGSGRPVLVMLVGGSFYTYNQGHGGYTNGVSVNVRLLRNGSSVSETNFSSGAGGMSQPNLGVPAALSYLDVSPGSAPVTYKVQVQGSSQLVEVLAVRNTRLLAFEL